MKPTAIFNALLAVFASTGFRVLAQEAPVPPPAPSVPLRSSLELDQLLGPIALYPDPLIAQILPAATLPSQVVLADRFVSNGGDPNLIDQQPWDSSVKALARYPEVLRWMDDNLAWTTELGQAFLYQQVDVMTSIQHLRAQAQAFGNLESTPQENVVTDDGTIEILPASPEVIYVPVYQPDLVYYEHPHGRSLVSFGLGFRLGAWLDHDFDWGHHNVIVWGHDHPRPADWWSHRPSERPHPEATHFTVWQGSHVQAATPGSHADRGWDAREAHPAPARIAQPSPKPAEPRRIPPVAARTVAPPAIQHPPASSSPPQPEPRRTPTVEVRPVAPPAAQPSVARSSARSSGGALIGIQSARDTHQFSTRGQQSLQTAARPATAPRPATPAALPHAPSAPVQKRP